MARLEVGATAPLFLPAAAPAPAAAPLQLLLPVLRLQRCLLHSLPRQYPTPRPAAQQTTPAPPRARSAGWPTAAGAAGVPAGARSAASAACCCCTGAAVPAWVGVGCGVGGWVRTGSAQCYGTHGSSAGASTAAGGPSAQASLPHRPLRCPLRACARLAVATVRWVVWKESTEGSQGMPQCASMARVVPSCSTAAAGDTELISN